MLRLAVIATLAVATLAMIPNLQKPDVDVGTKYYFYYNATIDRNVTVFEAYRINSVLQWGVNGDNMASPGGEIGFITEEYGQSSGYILRYCVEVLVPHGVSQDAFEHGNTDAFASYECCGSGSCSGCGYTGSGINTNPAMVGRSYNLDKPYFANAMSKEFGWWYSFNQAGYCKPGEALGTNGCTYRSSPYVDMVKLQDINTLPGWTNSPSTVAEWQTLNNMMVNAYSTSLMSSFTYNPAANKYTALNGQFHADPANQCRVSCPLGTYSTTGLLDAFSTNGQCAPCPQGTYADSLGSTSCSACPAGLTTNGNGAVSVSACFSPSTPVCAPGTYNQYTGHSPCTSCPAGYYQPAHSAQSCLQCPQFTTSNAVGASSATACTLNPPQAVSLFSYSPTNSAGSIAGNIIADANGEVGYLQTNNWGQTISESGTVSLRCIEAVDVPFFANQYSCWGTYCTFPNNNLNLPINGTSGQYASPNYLNNGHWYIFPKTGECTNQQLPGQGGCTWKASTIVLEANLGALVNESFYSCQAANPLTYCWSQLTQQQWQNSTEILNNFADYATLSSTISTSSSTVLGPVSVQNGRCVVQCPSGYTFRSAFTTPYCVPSSSVTSSTTFLASDVDVEAADNSSQTAAVVGASVASVAVVAVVAALVAYRIKRRRSAVLF